MAKSGGLPTLQQALSGSKGGSGLPSSSSLPSLSDALSGKSTSKPVPPPSSHHTLFGNLIHDTENAVTGIVPGLVATAEHPERAGKALAANYAQTYGPLLHGQFGKFYANVHAHPLGPLLDAATVLALGAGLGAKAGVLSSEAGDLIVPDLAKQIGQEGGEDVVMRKTATNPLIRTRQMAVNKALNDPRLNDVPVVGSRARLARTVGRVAVKEGLSLKLKAVPFTKAFSRLRDPEKAAWHLRMMQVDPHDYSQLLEQGAVKNPSGTEAAMRGVLNEPKLNELFHTPSPRLQDALTKGRALSDLMTKEKVARGYVEEGSAVTRPYLEQRILSGATHVEGQGFVGGKDVETLMRENAAKGDEQPSYVPHSAETGKLPRQSWAPQATAPAPLGSTKLNTGTLFTKGMLNLKGDPLSAEFNRFTRHVQRGDVHGALMEVAAKEPVGGPPLGYRFLKTTAGQKSAPYTVRAAASLKDALKGSEDKQSLIDRFTTTNPEHADIATDGEGHRLIVPDDVAGALAHDAAPTKNLARTILYNKPTTIWKHLVLGLRPAYMANIVLSQHILGFLQRAGGGQGELAYLNHVIPGARLGKLNDATLEDVMPEQASGSFAQSTGTTGGRGVAAKVYQGVMPATMKAENWLRRLMVEGWAKSSPEIRAAMTRNGGDINQAMREVAKSDPHVLDEISQRVDHAQGNYRTYSPAEQKLRQIVPFYGWDKHIIQSTYRILAEHPLTANVGYNAGMYGTAVSNKEFGALPTYLQGIVKLGGLPKFMGPLNGRTPVISTKAIGPFSADADILRTAEGLVHGRAGTSSEMANDVNPLLTSLIQQITGRDIVTGTTVRDKLPFGLANVFIRAGLSVPQLAPLEDYFKMHPLGQSPNPVSQADWQSAIAAMLGTPVKKLDVPHANLVASKQGQPPTG